MKSKKILSTFCWTSLSACILSSTLKAEWGPVTPVSFDKLSFGPRIAVDASCDTIAIWEQSDDTNVTVTNVTNVKSAQLPFQGSWTSPVIVEALNDVPSFSAFPSIAIADNGLAIAVYSNISEIDPNTFVASTKSSTVQFGGSWRPPVIIGSNNNVGPEVLITPDGNARAFFGIFDSQMLADSDPTLRASSQTASAPSPSAAFVTGIIQSTDLPFGASSWTPPITAPASLLFNQVLFNANGYTVLVGQSSNTPGSPFFSSTLPYGGTSWSSPIEIPGSNNAVVFSQFGGIDNAGNIVLAWLGIVNGIRVVQASTLPFGGTWTPAVDVTPPNQSYFSNLQAVVNPLNGDAIVLVTTRDPVSIVQYSRLLPDGSWTAPINVSTPGIRSFISSQKINAAFDACGNVIAVWQAVIDGFNVVQSAILPHNSNVWTTPVTISNLGQNSVAPAITVSPDGYAVVIWFNRNVRLDTSIIETVVWTPPTTIIFNVTPNCADAGKTATITGEGFCSVTAVRFGGVDTDFIRNSSTSITATVPYGLAGTTVSVEISGECGAPVLGQYTYPPLPPSRFKGCIQECNNECILDVSWKASKSQNIVKYNIYRKDKLIATISADSDLSFEKKLSKCRLDHFSITAVDQFCQESAHVKLKCSRRL